jgi:cytochrome c oxidase subunit 4
MSAEPASRTNTPSLRNQLGVLLALLVLLLLSAGSALLSLGVFNTVANIGIAVIKVSLVMIFFMRLRSASPLVRLVSLAGFAWLAMLIVLAVADFLTRAPLPAPW